MVLSKFPTVRLERSEESLGLIVQRNFAASIATGDIIFSLDDDAEFTTVNIVNHVLKEFTDSRIGVVAIPYLEPRKDNTLYQSAPDSHGIWVTNSFIGTAHALKRDIFLRLGGYREHLVHQGEEGDYALRLMEAGYVVRLSCADPIKHWESPKRDLSRMDYYGTRNSILFVWQNAPLVYLPVNIIVTTFKCLFFTIKPERLWNRLYGIFKGYHDCFFEKRLAVSWRTYRIWRYLRKRGPRGIEKVVPSLNNM